MAGAGRRKAIEKKQLNTPINSLILDEFRKSCEEYHLKMNVVLEALMNEFIDGNYELIISRQGVKIKLKSSWQLFDSVVRYNYKTKKKKAVYKLGSNNDFLHLQQ